MMTNFLQNFYLKFSFTPINIHPTIEFLGLEFKPGYVLHPIHSTWTIYMNVHKSIWVSYISAACGRHYKKFKSYVFLIGQGNKTSDFICTHSDNGLDPSLTPCAHSWLSLLASQSLFNDVWTLPRLCALKSFFPFLLFFPCFLGRSLWFCGTSSGLIVFFLLRSEIKCIICWAFLDVWWATSILSDWPLWTFVSE